MDTNECDTNLLNADFLLPPRKRLLAGLKKQSFSESTSQCSQEKNHSPSVLSPNPLSEFDLRLNNLLKSYENGSTMSPLEIAEAAQSKATKAAEAAKAARATAQEKAAIAAKAVASAKSALDFVSSIPRYQPVENCGMDEELARRLHRSMNSSPRISKHSLVSKNKNYKHKRLKIFPPSERSGIGNGGNLRDMNSEGSNEEPYTIKVDDKVSRFSRLDNEIEVDSGETESSHAKRKAKGPVDEMCMNDRKRCRTKQKRLPLSICSFKDQANSKEGLNLTNPLLMRHRTYKPTVDNLSPVQITSVWKCQDFKVSQYIKPDKVVQS